MVDQRWIDGYGDEVKQIVEVIRRMHKRAVREIEPAMTATPSRHSNQSTGPFACTRSAHRLKIRSGHCNMPRGSS